MFACSLYFFFIQVTLSPVILKNSDFRFMVVNNLMLCGNLKLFCKCTARYRWISDFKIHCTVEKGTLVKLDNFWRYEPLKIKLFPLYRKLKQFTVYCEVKYLGWLLYSINVHNLHNLLSKMNFLGAGIILKCDWSILPLH